MEYKLPELPKPDRVQGTKLVPYEERIFSGSLMAGKLGYSEFIKNFYTDEQMRQYAEQAVAPLLAEIERLKRGEFICKECGLRKNSTTTECGF